MKEPLPSDFDWVLARSECSLQRVFYKLEREAKQNVEQRNRQLDKQPPFIFSEGDGKEFSVSRGDYSVVFGFEPPAITAKGPRVKLRATLTLNDNAECKLLVENQELDRWQFLRRALEGFFFEFKPKSQ